MRPKERKGTSGSCSSTVKTTCQATLATLASRPAGAAGEVLAFSRDAAGVVRRVSRHASHSDPFGVCRRRSCRALVGVSAATRMEAQGIDCQHREMNQADPITAIGHLLEQYSEIAAAEKRVTFNLNILRQRRILSNT